MKNLPALFLLLITIASCNAPEQRTKTSANDSGNLVLTRYTEEKPHKGLSIKASLSEGDDFSIVR